MLTSRQAVDFPYTRQELGRLELKAFGRVKHGDVPLEEAHDQDPV